MILRKPYAFLIKYFKVIHLLLTLLLAFILYKTNALLSFFNQYLSSKSYEVLDNLASTYLGGYLYLAIFLSIIISIVIFLLMRKKEKPIRYYLILIIYYIVLTIGLLFVSSQLTDIGFNKINVLLLRLSRDILLVLFFTQIPFVLISLSRAVGFNVKKFNFQKDLIELQVEEQDNEEFELDVDIDSFDVKTRFHRRLRLMGYVLKENRLVVVILLGILLITSGVVVNNTIYKDNYVYSEEKTFPYNGLEMTTLSSYQMDTDFFGKDISNKKDSYTVVRMKARNVTNRDLSVVMKGFTLKIGDKIYSSSTKQKNSFIPLGDTSDVITVAGKSEKIFIVIFKIDKEDKNKKQTMEYAGSYKMSEGERVYNIKKVRLTPKTVSKNKTVKSAKLKETLDFSGSILGNSSITINSVDIQDKFIYLYKQCLKECNDFNDYIVPKVNTKYYISIMRLEVKTSIDKKIFNDKLEDKLISTTAHLRYVLDGKEYTQNFSIEDITPDIVHDYKYYEIKGEAKKADAIYLDFILLDKVYTYVLKEA